MDAISFSISSTFFPIINSLLFFSFTIFDFEEIKLTCPLSRLNNSNNIYITSDFGKYNIENFDTIFSKNVISKYLDNKITGEYLDFSLNRNSIIISRNVVYSNFENILESDVIEMDLNTKDTKVFMYKDNEKVNIKNKN